MNQPIDKEIKIAYLKKIDSGELTAVEAAREIGVTKSAVYEWRKSYAKNANQAMPGKGHQTPDDAELRKLREKVKQLEAENTFLKKAAKGTGRNRRRALCAVFAMILGENTKYFAAE